MGITAMVTFALLLALVNERINELLTKKALRYDQYDDQHWTRQAMPFIAMATGLLIGIPFQVDIVTPLAIEAGAAPLWGAWPGVVLTAVLVGGGSNLIHDLWPQRLSVLEE